MVNAIRDFKWPGSAGSGSRVYRWMWLPETIHYPSQCPGCSGCTCGLPMELFKKTDRWWVRLGIRIQPQFPQWRNGWTVPTIPEFTVLNFTWPTKIMNGWWKTTELLLERAAIATQRHHKVMVGGKRDRLQSAVQKSYHVRSDQRTYRLWHFGHGRSRYPWCMQATHIHPDPKMGKGKLIDEIFGAKCEGNYVQPTFITDYPVEMSLLTKKHRSKPGLVERFELMCNKWKWMERSRMDEWNEGMEWNGMKWNGMDEWRPMARPTNKWNDPDWIRTTDRTSDDPMYPITGYLSCSATRLKWRATAWLKQNCVISRLELYPSKCW